MNKMSNDKVIYKYTFNLEKAKQHVPQQLAEYAEKNNLDGMIYVGSTNNAKKRHYQHKIDKGHDKFHKVTKMFDLDLCFDYEVLWCDNHANIETIREVEQKFIDELQPFDDNGFNTCKTTVLSDKELNRILNKSVLIGLFDPVENFRLIKIFKSKTDVDGKYPVVDILPKNIRGKEGRFTMPLKLLSNYYNLDFEFNIGEQYDELFSLINFTKPEDDNLYCVYKFKTLIDVCKIDEIEQKYNIASKELKIMVDYNEMIKDYNISKLTKPQPLIINVSKLSTQPKKIVNGQIQYR